MKRIILTIICMMMLTSAVNAQVKVVGTSTTERLLSVRMGFITLNYNDGYYLAMSTTNRFDDPIILPLGKEKGEAVQTLESLIDITASIKKGESVTIETSYGKKLQIYRYAKNTISIYTDGRAGSSNATKAELTRCLESVTFDMR